MQSRAIIQSDATRSRLRKGTPWRVFLHYIFSLVSHGVFNEWTYPYPALEAYIYLVRFF